MCVCIYFALILFSQTATHITGVNLTDWILAREKFWVILHCRDFYNFATTVNTLFNRTVMCDKFITSMCLFSWHFFWCHRCTMISDMHDFNIFFLQEEQGLDTRVERTPSRFKWPSFQWPVLAIFFHAMLGLPVEAEPVILEEPCLQCR